MSYISGKAQGQALYDSLSTAKGTTAKKESYELSGDPSKAEAESASYSKAACGRANLRAAGWGEEDFSKPVITVGVPYSNALPCNNRTRELGDVICAAIEREGGGAERGLHVRAQLQGGGGGGGGGGADAEPSTA